MNTNKKIIHPEIKNRLHLRNPHRFRYDFEKLIKNCAELSPYVSRNMYGDESIDFADPQAVKMLNRALLKHFYGILYWDIPKNYLCPPIPGRADYIHYIADLLGMCNDRIIPRGKNVSVLDIGTGANCVYPIIGHHEYGWRFTGTDIDPVSIASAEKIVKQNPCLSGQIELRLQKSTSDIFAGIIKENEFFDVTMCNPPFHSSPEEAASGTIRKVSNLTAKSVKQPALNFGGQNSELWTPGGEENFIRRMVEESSRIPEKCLWFTTLVSKKTTLPSIYKALKKAKALEVKTVDMMQGHKKSRFVAWSYLDKDRQSSWSRKRWKQA